MLQAVATLSDDAVEDPRTLSSATHKLFGQLKKIPLDQNLGASELPVGGPRCDHTITADDFESWVGSCTTTPAGPPHP